MLPHNQYADGWSGCCGTCADITIFPSNTVAADLAYGCLANKLELLMRPSTRQHFLQLGWSEEELKVDLCVSMVLLVLLDTNRVHMS